MLYIEPVRIGNEISLDWPVKLLSSAAMWWQKHLVSSHVMFFYEYVEIVWHDTLNIESRPLYRTTGYNIITTTGENVTLLVLIL